MSGPLFPIGRCSYSGIVPSDLAALLRMRNGSDAGRKMFEGSQHTGTLGHHQHTGDLTNILVIGCQ